MTLFENTSKRPADAEGRGATALIVETLGTVSIVAYYFFGPRELRGLDMVMLFVIVSFAVFLLVRYINQLREPDEGPPLPPSIKKCPYCVSDVPVQATRCPHCTSDLAETAAKAAPDA